MHFVAVIAMALLFAVPVMAADINTSSWSETDNNNNQAPPAGWPENMNPAQVNDSARANMGAIKRWYDRISPTATTAGTANAQTLTYSVAPTMLTTGDRYSFIVGPGLSASAATLNINTQSAA